MIGQYFEVYLESVYFACRGNCKLRCTFEVMLFSLHSWQSLALGFCLQGAFTTSQALIQKHLLQESPILSSASLIPLSSNFAASSSKPDPPLPPRGLTGG